MQIKILLADDSLTIQKVIQITLASEPYEIINCSKDSELENLLTTHQPQMVLLDFNLSEIKTGYELSQDIKAIVPSAHVVMMYGTFDNIDDDQLKKSGCHHHIIKPFDSGKFVTLCKSLIDQPKEELPLDQFETTDDLSVPPEIPHKKEVLLTESQWENNVPNIINSEISEINDLPPVIETSHTINESASNLKRDLPPVVPEPILPDDSELDYPDPIELEINNYQPKSKLIPANELQLDTQEIEINLVDQATDVFDLNEFSFDDSANEEENLKKLEAQIEDEVSENLWKIDEIDSSISITQNASVNNVTSLVNEDKSLLKDVIDLSDLVEEKIPVSQTSPIGLDEEQIRKIVREEVQLFCRDYVNEVIKKETHKNSWKIVAETAEKVIAEELRRLSREVSGDS